MAENSHTRKPGKVGLHPLKFEDALKGLLKSKQPGKRPAFKGNYGATEIRQSER